MILSQPWEHGCDRSSTDTSATTGVSGNIQALKGFRYEVLRTWQWALKRRSQKAKATWERMTRLEKRWLPRARIYHPYPSLSTAVTTQGKSPVP
jgi:RNA-directed DNA polymerase